jgi:CelD/BcsL family acetyltransferase involved in cellulose biosynthesis
MGVPPHSVDYYIECYRAFGDRMKIFWAIRHGKTIAGLLGFASGQRVNIVNTVSDAVAWEHRPNDLLHWEYIKWAHGQGYGYFDFGSVRYEGQFRYKEKWGCTITKHGHYFIPAGDTVGKSTFDSSSRTMQMFAKTWSRYVPCSVSIVVGPMIRKQLVR